MRLCKSNVYSLCVLDQSSSVPYINQESPGKGFCFPFNNSRGNKRFSFNWTRELGFPGGSSGKESSCNAGDLSSIAGLGRSPGGGRDNPLQYSCLENPHGQRSRKAAVHGIAKSRTQRKQVSTHWCRAERASQVLLMVKNPMQETWQTRVQSLGWGDPLEEGVATHCSILSWSNLMDRRAWRATVRKVHKESDTTGAT